MAVSFVGVPGRLLGRTGFYSVIRKQWFMHLCLLFLRLCSRGNGLPNETARSNFNIGPFSPEILLPARESLTRTIPPFLVNILTNIFFLLLSRLPVCFARNITSPQFQVTTSLSRDYDRVFLNFLTIYNDINLHDSKRYFWASYKNCLLNTKW